MAGELTELTETLDGATAGNRSDVYSLLATWTSVVERATGRNGHDGFREVTDPTRADVIDFVDRSATAPTAGPSETGETASAIDWALLRESVDAYPPGVGDHYCSTILASVIARCVIRTYIRTDVDDIPAWALEYLIGITMDEDREWAFESSLAVGWGVGHSEVSVLDRTIARAEAHDESWAFGVLDHVTCADPDAGVELFERHLRSSETYEDLVVLRGLESAREGTFPDTPEYWEPAEELEYVIGLSRDHVDRILAVLGETVDPDRLRRFDEHYAFDLTRAATEFGTADSDRPE